MRKIVFILPSFDVGGAQKFVFNLCSYLREKNTFIISIVALRRSKKYFYKDELQSLGIKIIDFNKKKASFAMFDLIKYLLTQKPNIIFSTVYNIEFISAICCLFYKGDQFIIRKASFLYNKSILFGFIKKDLFQNIIADKIVVLTDEMKKYVSPKKYGNSKIFVIPNMIDKKRIISKITKTPLHDLMHEKDEIVIINIGRLVYQKGHDILIKAFSKLLEEYSNIRLIIIGDGVRKKYLEKLANEIAPGKVNFLGNKVNPYKYLYYSDIFVLSSIYEGFPNVILESFCCKTPVISFDCPTGPSEIIENFKTGLLVDSYSISQLSNRIELLIKNRKLRKFLANNAFSAVEKYSMDNIGSKYIKLFN